MPDAPLILGIETSCDDTACAVVDGAGRVLASVVSRQIDEHRPFGGVVPEIASRAHLGNWPAVSAEALARAGVDWADLDAVAATRGPGLVGCLLVGLSIGRAVALGRGRPFFGVHHMAGHLVSPFLDAEGGPAADLPARFTGLIVSGGHTLLVEARADGAVETVAETRDDALGEVFDKVGKRLGLAYPQGPIVDRLAEDGDPAPHAKAFFVKTGRRGRTAAKADAHAAYFTYSGLKSQALRAIERLERSGALAPLPPGAIRAPEDLPSEARDLLAAFRAAAVDQLVDRLTQHHDRRPVRCLAVSGGAAANRLLRRRMTDWCAARGIDLRLVPLTYAGDNAAMIAFEALLRHRRGDAGDDPRSVEVASRIPLDATAAAG
ncbi:MAG: tRNA (adenosine(37)-N6)-threonylcarbamoyltransferase complex transferase subunit TsaD [Acidobacteriota bacterium]